MGENETGTEESGRHPEDAEIVNEREVHASTHRYLFTSAELTPASQSSTKRGKWPVRGDSHLQLAYNWAPGHACMRTVQIDYGLAYCLRAIH